MSSLKDSTINGDLNITGELSVTGINFPDCTYPAIIKTGRLQTSIPANSAILVTVPFDYSFEDTSRLRVFYSLVHDSQVATINHKIRRINNENFTLHVLSSGAGNHLICWLALYV